MDRHRPDTRPLLPLLLPLLIAAAAPAAGPPARAAEDTATPAGAMAAMVRAVRDADAPAVRSLLDAASPAEQQFADVTARYWAAAGAVWKALDGRFGDGASRRFSSFLPRPQDFDRFTAAEWAIADDGATATAAGPPATKLRKVDGVWKLSPTTRKLSDRELRSLARRDAATAALAARLARDIEQGRYSTPAEAQAALDAAQTSVGRHAE